VCTQIKVFDSIDWSLLAAELIQNAIQAILAERRECHVMLTGGRSAQQLYVAWAQHPAFLKMSGVNFYFGDERCVPPDHVESNCGMVMQSLFHSGIPAGCKVFCIEASDPDHEASALRYDRILPNKIDVLLLGVGEDGHVASLFPYSPVLQEVIRRVMPAIGSKLPQERLTITPAVIADAGVVFVLATGAEKAQVFVRALRDPCDIISLPARLALNATWLLDSPLPSEVV
jgi:6-phosphogluconolactonase